MKLNDIADIRLVSQQIAGTTFKSPKDLVGWMGAIQAQDYPMAKWALGVRLPHSTDNLIEGAINRGEIIRTHVLRPTWHFVSADDIRWMLELSAPRIKASLRSGEKAMGLTETLFARSNRVIRNALTPGTHLDREKLIAELKNAGIPTDQNKSSHLFLRAELDGIMCSGRTNGTTRTYALLEKRVPRGTPLSRDASLAKLARKYFLSHGPATVQDFTWWSGLSTTDARCALEMVRSDFVSEIIGANTYWLPNSLSLRKAKKTTTCLLPAFDEFLISYKDRSAAVDPKHHTKAISDNGIFRPVIVINGRVSALWKRTSMKEKVVVEARFFRAHTQKERQMIQDEVGRFGDFLGRKTELNYGTY